jgi:MraZ protein
MFLGEFNHAIDEKGRITIPAKFRAQLAEGLVVTKGIERCLSVFPLDKWEEWAREIIQPSIFRRDSRVLRRHIFPEAVECQLDAQGRILLPESLRSYASLEGRAVVIGVYTHLEIWNPSSWNEVKTGAEKEIGDISEHLAQFLEKISLDK